MIFIFRGPAFRIPSLDLRKYEAANLLMVAFIIFRSINQTFSALLFDLQLEWGEKDYFSSKSASEYNLS